MNEMVALMCPHCRYVWQPRVKSPKQCPACKRNFRLTKPEEVDQDISRDWIVSFNADIADTEDIVLCSTCTDRGQGHEGIYTWLDGKTKYCLTHLIEETIGFDKEATYRNPDGIGSIASMRDEIRSIFHEALLMCEEILVREEF